MRPSILKRTLFITYAFLNNIVSVMPLRHSAQPKANGPSMKTTRSILTFHRELIWSSTPMHVKSTDSFSLFHSFSIFYYWGWLRFDKYIYPSLHLMFSPLGGPVSTFHVSSQLLCCLFHTYPHQLTQIDPRKEMPATLCLATACQLQQMPASCICLSTLFGK
jgi:hypothetical protein